MMVEFSEVFTDSTKFARKIKKGDYLDSGTYPIIDQGQEFVIGYTNDGKGLYKDVPAIIFGDHTRIIKYIDRPFFIGADGVKVLKTKIDDADYKYLFYALRNIEIINTGYNRHFKWLKESKIKLPELKKQQKIATILDSIENILNLKNTQLQEYDQLIKSRFVEMFGDDLKGKTIRLGDLSEVITKGTTPTTLGFDFVDEGINFVKIECITDNYQFLKEKMLHITSDCDEKLKRSRLKDNDVLFSIAGAIGRTAIVTKDILPANTNQALAIIRLKEKSGLNVEFLNEMLHTELIQEQVSKKAMGVAQINLSLTDIANLNVIVPSLNRQQDFSNFVKQVDKLKFEVQKSLDETQMLFDSLMQEYFG
jgi:type I restriction enzyme S subunit